MIAFPNQPTPDQPTPDRPGLNQPDPNQPTPDQPGLNQPDPNQGTPDFHPPAHSDAEPPFPVSDPAGSSSLATSASSIATSASSLATAASSSASSSSATSPSPSATPPSGAVSPFLVNDTERLGDEIARLAAHIHAATYRLLVLIRVFDEQEGWAWGFRSCAQWLSWRTGISPGAAREKVRAARALGPLPKISEAMARGELSYSKVRAMTRVASEANEEDLLMVARHATASHVERLVRGWRMVDQMEMAEKEFGGAAEAGSPEGAEGGAAAHTEAERHERRYLELYPGEDGMYELRGRLDPEVGALLEKALEWAGEALYRKEERADEHQTRADTETTHGQRWADAIGLAAERALAGVGSETRDATTPMGRADRFQVVLHVEEKREERDRRGREEDSSVGELGHSVPAPKGRNVPAGTSGLSVPPEATKRITCDANLIHMTHDAHGTILDVGRKRRTVPPAIRRGLDYRDGGCRFPGCGCRYTDAHHVVHWADGGETKLENLLLLCRRHHRAVHEEGFRVEVAQSGHNEGKTGLGVRNGAGTSGSHRFRVSFFRPDGQPFPEVPELPTIPGAPARAMMKGNRAKDVDPGPWTPTPLWHGEPLDLGLAVDMFRGLEKERDQEERAQEERAQEERAQEERVQEERAQEERAQEERAQEERVQEERAQEYLDRWATASLCGFSIKMPGAYECHPAPEALGSEGIFSERPRRMETPSSRTSGEFNVFPFVPPGA